MRKVAVGCFVLTALAIVVAWASWMSAPTYAFDQYSLSRTAGNCADCHSNFRGTAPYSSQSDGAPWTAGGINYNLHDGHRTLMLSGDCSTCHSGTSRFPVLLNLSIEGLASSVQGFETSHPRLAEIINTFCTMLSNLGI